MVFREEIISLLFILLELSCHLVNKMAEERKIDREKEYFFFLHPLLESKASVYLL